MSHAPLISVIIPTKNRLAMVDRAIKSVQNQTYKNIEILLVDDASTDDTLNHVERLRAADQRLFVFHNESSLGGAGARNVGLKNARGDYFAFLDDDDEWLPNKLEIQLDFLQKNNSINAVSCWHMLKIGDQVQQIEKPAQVTFADLLWENFLGSFSFCLVARRVIEKIGLLDAALPSAQDWDFWLRTARNFRIHIIAQCLVVYNRHDQTRISSSYAGKVKGAEIIYQKYRADMTDACARHHQKYLCYYKSLAEQSRLKRLKYLAGMLIHIDKRQDWLLILNSLGRLLLPAKLAEWFRRAYRKRIMEQTKRLLTIE